MVVEAPDPVEEEIEVLKDADDHSRIEFWTDAEYIHIGRDILNDRSVVIPAMDVSEVREKVVDINTAGVVRAGHREYLVEESMDYDLYRNRKHVLHMDKNATVLHQALQKVRKERRDYDPLEVAKTYVEKVKPIYMDIEKIRGFGGSDSRVSVDVINSLEDGEEQGVVMWGFVEKLREESAVTDDQPGVTFDPDGIHYSFTVDSEVVRNEYGF